MKRDDDYLRDLLIELEAQEDYVTIIYEHLSMNDEENKKLYHVNLLCDVGFMTQINEHAYRMTNDGHDYLETIRNDAVWQKTKEGAAKIGGATLGIMKDIALAYVKKEAAEKLGMTL